MYGHRHHSTRLRHVIHDFPHSADIDHAAASRTAAGNWDTPAASQYPGVSNIRHDSCAGQRAAIEQPSCSRLTALPAVRGGPRWRCHGSQMHAGRWHAQNGHAATVRLLLDAGAKVNLEDSDGGSALMLAAESGHSDALQALLKAGAWPRRALPDGTTALHFAAENGDSASVQALLKAGADCTDENDEGETPLSLAIKGNHEKIIRLLRVHGAIQ